MAENQQMDHYDFINAPQFVDFDDLAAHDDPQADKFFETHREEDDFMIPLDINNISPTVQLLYHDEQDDNNEHYSNEANKAAKAAGLEDVNIEYYASPQNHSVKALSQPSSANRKSYNSVYGTPLGPLGASGCSSGAGSFHTPTGGSEDKENVTPAASSAKKLKNESVKKINCKPEIVEDTASNNGQRSILAERSVGDYSSPRTYTPSSSVGTPTAGDHAESLYSKLDQLLIVSSDEEDSAADYCMSSKLQQDSIHQEPIEAKEGSVTNYSTFNEDKLSFLGLPVSNENRQQTNFDDDSSSSEHGDVTLICHPPSENNMHQDIPISPIQHRNSDSEEEEGGNNESAPMELGTPIRNILRKLDAELHMDLEHQDMITEPRCSILVAPRVGQQVHWNQEAESSEHGLHMTNQRDVGVGRELNVSYKVDDMSMNFNNHATVTYDYFDESDDEFAATSLVSGRRASSVGDLVTALEPKSRGFKTYGFNPRVGITIPKTPDCEESERVVNQGEKQGPSTLEAFSSNKNACYFEIEAPMPVKSVRRVSSCSDLLKLQEVKAKQFAGRKSVTVQKRLPTIPRTPEALKRSQKIANRSNIPSTLSSCSKPESNNVNRKREVGGPSMAERLAKARQPMKGNHYVSMAEAMIKFQKNTPDRFRSLPRGHTVPEKRSASCESRKRFSPSPARSPESNQTLRGDSFTSRSKPTAGSSGPTLPKRVEMKPTVPKPFNFGSTHRPKQAVVKEDTVDFKFKARPAPSKASHENAIARGRPPVKVTLPQSPRFASDERLRERQQKRAHNTTVTAKSPESKQTKGKPQPKISRIPTTATCRGPVEDHKTTVAQPFSSSFEARQKDILRKKEEKIKQELERANKIPEFHANPVPKFSGKLPKKKLVEATHVEPFRLKSDERGAAYQEAFKQKLEEEEQQMREQAQFYAQPADVIHKAPFEPERPARVIETQELHLATERRAAEREQYDEQLREKEREDEERRREEQELLEEQQKQEDIERRRQLVHKAQPFKPPKPFLLKASGKTLTVPQSPAFSALPSARRIKTEPHSPNTTYTAQ